MGLERRSFEFYVRYLVFCTTPILGELRNLFPVAFMLINDKYNFGWLIRGMGHVRHTGRSEREAHAGQGSYVAKPRLVFY